MIPCTWALLAMGLSSINLLFGRGDFGQGSITQTTYCLWAYGLGIIPQTLVIIFASALYAQKNYLMTTRIALASLGVNVALNTVFVFGFGMSSASVAFATSIAACMNFFALAVVLWLRLIHEDKALQPLLRKELKTTFLCAIKISVCSFIAAAVVVTAGYLILQDRTLPLFLSSIPQIFPKEFVRQLMTMIIEASCFAALVLLGAWWMRVEDLTGLFRFNLKKPSFE
jgi:putative peptidoglycan lipid II flippase